MGWPKWRSSQVPIFSLLKHCPVIAKWPAGQSDAGEFGRMGSSGRHVNVNDPLNCVCSLAIPDALMQP